MYSRKFFICVYMQSRKVNVKENFPYWSSNFIEITENAVSFIRLIKRHNIREIFSFVKLQNEL